MQRRGKDDEQMLAVARQLMERYNPAFSVLAMGEASPYMTEEFREEMDAAKKRTAPYTIKGRID